MERAFKSGHFEPPNHPVWTSGSPSVTPWIFGVFLLFFLSTSHPSWTNPLWLLAHLGAPFDPFDLHITFIGPIDYHLPIIFSLFLVIYYLPPQPLPSTIHPSSLSLSIIPPVHNHHHYSPRSSSPSSASSSLWNVKISGLIGLGGSWVRLWLPVGCPC